MTPRGVAGLVGGDIITRSRAPLSYMEMVWEAHGDSGGPMSPTADEKTTHPSVPLSTAPLFCVPGGQVGSDWQCMQVFEGPEAEQSQVRLLEGSCCLRPRRKRKAPWGWLTLRESVFSLDAVPYSRQEHICPSEAHLCPGGNSSPADRRTGGRKQKKTMLRQKVPNSRA